MNIQDGGLNKTSIENISRTKRNMTKLLNYLLTETKVNMGKYQAGVFLQYLTINFEILNEVTKQC